MGRPGPVAASAGRGWRIKGSITVTVLRSLYLLGPGYQLLVMLFDELYMRHLAWFLYRFIKPYQMSFFFES